MDNYGEIIIYQTEDGKVSGDKKGFVLGETKSPTHQVFIVNMDGIYRMMIDCFAKFTSSVLE